MSEEPKNRTRCEAHDMVYDPTVHSGCIVCRREESNEEEPAVPRKRVWPYAVAVMLAAIALGGVGLGIYGHRVQQAMLDAENPTEPIVGSVGGALPDGGVAEPMLMLGRTGVDEYGYPNDLPDKLTLLGLLREKQYRKLSSALESFEDEARADFHKEKWPIVAFQAFHIPDRRLGRRFDGWVKATPRSFAPYLARAEHRTALAYHYRGGNWAHLTSKKRFAKMRRLLTLASKDVERALERRPDLTRAHSLRLSIAKGMDADVAARTKIVEEALRHCAYCFGPRATYLSNIIPRWGGSYALMKRKAEGWQYVDKNPKLRQLLGFVDADLCSLPTTEDPARQMAHCDKALKAGGNAGFHADRGRLLLRLERYDEGIAALDAALAISPQSVQMLADRGFALLKLERYDEAARDLALAIRLDPTNSQAETSLHHILAKLVRMAYYQAEAGEVDDAIANYDRVLAMHPRYADALAYRGYAYTKKNDLERAERDLLQAIKIDPKNLEAYRGLDAVLFRQKRLDEIIGHWNRYLKRNPKDADALFERSGTYYHKGQMKLAIRDVTAACRLGHAEACATQRRFAVAR